MGFQPILCRLWVSPHTDSNVHVDEESEPGRQYRNTSHEPQYLFRD